MSEDTTLPPGAKEIAVIPAPPEQQQPEPSRIEPPEYPGLFLVSDERQEEYKRAIDGLNDRQKRFVHAMLLDPTNQTAAAEAAGYSPKNASQKGSNLVRHPKVAHAIAVAMNARAERTQITSDRIMHELGVIGLSNIADYLVDEAGNVILADGVPEYAMRAVSSIKRRVKTYFEDDGTPVREVEVELKLWNKVEVLRLLMQHTGMLKPGGGEGGTTINNVTVNQDNRQVWKVGDREITF